MPQGGLATHRIICLEIDHLNYQVLNNFDSQKEMFADPFCRGFPMSSVFCSRVSCTKRVLPVFGAPCKRRDLTKGAFWFTICDARGSTAYSIVSLFACQRIQNQLLEMQTAKNTLIMCSVVSSELWMQIVYDFKRAAYREYYSKMMISRMGMFDFLLVCIKLCDFFV